MRVTDKGQITIPKELRDRLGMGPGAEVEFDVLDGSLVVRKTPGERARGRRIVDRMRGRGDVQLSTDEIMALTREG